MYITPSLWRQNGRRTLQWRHLCSLPKHPTEMHFNLAPDGIRQLAASQPIGRGNLEHLVIEPPTLRPRDYSRGIFFYSAASLQGVVEITPCRKRLKTHTAIVGLLFHYAGGSRACLGQFRMDWAEETLQVGHAQGVLHLGSSRGARMSPYLATLELVPRQTETGSLDWLHLARTGELEWLCGDGFTHCEVSHKGQQSPPLFDE